MSLHLREAASNFFRVPHSFSLLRGSPGSSGSVLARLETSDGSWCLREWPPGYEEKSLRFVHRALTHSRDGGLELLPMVVALAGLGLRDYPTSVHSASTLCHADLWAPHVHFDGPTFVGFVDFESLRFASPVIDLAQLILHFNGWASRDAVLEAYESIQPLGDEDRSVLPIVAAVGLASEGIWSLGLLYGEADRLAPIESRAHEANLDALLGSLETIVPSLEVRAGGLL